MQKLLFCLLFTGSTLSSVCLAEDTCPRTVGPTELSRWYGSESLAVQLPAGGVWPTTAPGNLIAVKLIWRSAGFRPGMESGLSVTVKPLNATPATAVVLGTTNAKLGDWAMMTGIDFPNAGCWEVTGRYLGEELRFVVETVQGASR
jgi:hypothetical protein